MMVKDVIPLYWFSTSSNIGDKENSSIRFQQTESRTVKTLHNSFQRKTTVMDYRLPWKRGWGTVNKCCGSHPQWLSTSCFPFFVLFFLFFLCFFLSSPLLSPLFSSPIFFYSLPSSIQFSHFSLSFFPSFPPPFPFSSLPCPLSYLISVNPHNHSSLSNENDKF